MNTRRSIATGKLLALMALTVASLSGRMLMAELTAPEESAGEYTVTWTEPLAPEDRLFLLEYRDSTKIGRYHVTDENSMKFCHPNGTFTYKLELCIDAPLGGVKSCRTLPGEVKVHVDRTLPDWWYERVRCGPRIREWGVHAVEADEGNFVLLCNRRPTFGPRDIYLVKLGRCGKRFWEHVLLSGEEVYSHELIGLNDGGYLIVGSMEDKLFVLRTNHNGIIIAKEFLNDLGTDARGRSAIQISEDNFIIAADAGTSDYGRQGILFEVRQVGDGFKVVAGRITRFGGRDSESVNQVIATADGGYAVVGTTDSWGEGDSGVYLVKISAQLKRQWQDRYGGKEDDYGKGVLQLSNGGFLLAGTTHSEGADYSDVYVVETEPDGTFVRDQQYKEPWTQTGEAIRHNPAGGYIVAGHGWEEVLFLHVDATSLEFEEHQMLPVGYLSYAGSLELTSAMGWVMAGSARFEGAVDWDAFLLYYKPGDWSGAYEGLFLESEGLSLYRVYRDRVLRSTPQGRGLVADIYANSRNVLITLLRHPQLMSQAQKLLEVNRAAVRDAVDGRPGVIEDSGTLLAFLTSFAERTKDDEIKALAKRVNTMIREHRRKGQPLFGFELRRDARSERASSADE